MHLQASKLVINLVEEAKVVPPAESLVFGQTKTDHMLVVHYDPVNGWSTPEIKPYGPLTIDPASSCLQYCPNIFEGMKAYIGPDGEARLFRPQRNMERFARSAARLALPKFDQEALLTLIKRLVLVDKRWIPTKSGYSLYIRPTLIGTHTGLGPHYSDTATLFVILTPSGPYFTNGLQPISLLGISETVRAWPGGTGAHKLGLNYAPSFLPQMEATAKGYDQILWLLEIDCQDGEKGKKDFRITEVGAMNIFLVVQRDDGDLDLITPSLDGTILPGVTRASTLALADAHTRGDIVLPNIPATVKIHTYEKPLTMSLLSSLSSQGKALEFFGVGTAAIVAPINKIGWEGEDVVFPENPYDETRSSTIGRAMFEMITNIQTGRTQFEDWGVVCE
ncbi:branched-chain-amino-acid transaminase [Macrolepiota fuliginosa MF-IS2]|uniref:Branched-chain-amino-acid aminotransferase n=1 Tax=Macrolepiota fuliginosa MF-IS2 TaxID=1400762 RepID=A0A9P5XFB9_9AGAR|nr:branched-chain-amino-acid transaminase [Macrolepiota fuliginosa MF-IS2]